MKARAAFYSALLLASSLAVHAWLRPPAPDPTAERSPEPASARPTGPPSPVSTAPPPAFPRVEPIPAAETRERPHPITAARAAISAQNSLFLQIESALSAHDVPRAKQLLRERELEFPDLDEGAEARQGYAAIARCIENPDAESRANGERFVTDHRASPLRRKVRRACLGARTPVMLPPA